MFYIMLYFMNIWELTYIMSMFPLYKHHPVYYHCQNLDKELYESE